MVVEVEGLVKRYDGRAVVDGLDIEVRSGEIFGILGANGAGKTTTVECIQGLRVPDAGAIRVLGLNPVRQRSQLRPLIGSQLQDSALPDRLRVREAVRLFSTSRSGEVADLLAVWGLADSSRQPFAKLSGGQQQRLLVALALLNRPEIVFLDELTRGLDPVARRDTWDVIRSVRDQGTTVVLVTHYGDEAEALCDRLAVIRDGRVLAAGTPTQLVDGHGRATHIVLRPTGTTDVAALEAIAGVAEVHTSPDRVEIVGTSGMIPYAAAELVRQGVIGDDFRITQGSLEDALVDLIGGAE